MKSLSLLRTRVARRILALFLACAILPVVTFALISYRMTANRLQSDARSFLREGSRTAGMLVMDRLQALVSELNAPVTRTSSFDAIALEYADGRLVPVRGNAFPRPRLPAAQSAQLAAGMPIIATDTGTGVLRVFFASPAPESHSGYPRRWGMIRPALLVGNDPALSLAPDGTELCLLEPRGAPLACPNPEAVRAFAEPTGSAPSTTWQRGDSVFLTARWSLFLGHEFASPPWTVGLSMPREAVLVPLNSFRRTFLLGVVLTAVLVFVLSHMQLRKRMTPLAELEAGVIRLGAGDFGTPVVVKSDDEFETLAGSFNGMAQDLDRQFATLTALRTLDVAALEGRSARAIAEAALQTAPRLLGGERAAVAFASAADPSCWTVCSADRDGWNWREEPAWPGPVELADLEKRSDAMQVRAGAPAMGYCPGQHIPHTMQRVVFPLRHNGHVHAVLIVGLGAAKSFSRADRTLGRQLADQLAIGLSNVSLISELDALSLGSMLALARTIDASSPWTAGHSERVTQGALEIGRRLGLDAESLERLRRGGLLHDIGKIGVPAAILDKPGRLTAAERALIQSHPVIGAEIIKPIAAFHELVPLVRHHHELLDGSGYPDGLAGAAIPLLVRILTVADVYDALVSDRPYRKGLSREQAFAILREGIGTQFDTRAVLALMDAVRAGWTPEPFVRRAGSTPDAGVSRLPAMQVAFTDEILV